MTIQQILLAGTASAATAPIWDSATVSSPLALSLSDKRVTLPISNTSVAKTVRATKPLTSGKWYWEVVIVDAIPGAGTTTGAGIADSTFAYATNNLGNNSTANSGGLWMSGSLFFNAASINVGQTWLINDTMMFALDIGAGSLWVGLNGSFIGNPAAGTGASKTGLNTGFTYYPACTPWSSNATHPVILELRGMTTATYSAPSGFTMYSA